MSSGPSRAGFNIGSLALLNNLLMKPQLKIGPGLRRTATPVPIVRDDPITFARRRTAFAGPNRNKGAVTQTDWASLSSSVVCAIPDIALAAGEKTRRTPFWRLQRAAGGVCAARPSRPKSIRATAYSQSLMRVRKMTLMRPGEFGEAVPAGTRLTLFSVEKPDRHFMVVTFLMDKVSGVMLDLRAGVPCYQVEDEEGRIPLLLQLPTGDENENRWCLWRPDQSGFDSRSIFDGALVEE
jgi:hypothetical protein